MALQSVHPPLSSAAPIVPSSDRLPDRYTGVVIVHGIGNERQSETLREALNAVTYWFNHKAGLALRAEGPGRIWLNTQLSDDNNPDAPASCATLELVPPVADQSASAVWGSDRQPPTLRTEWREVWWASSFGLPSLGKVFRWAATQYQQQAGVFAPVGLPVTPIPHRRRRERASHAQPHLTARTAAVAGDARQTDTMPSTSVTSPSSSVQGRHLQRAILALYDRVQAAWKFAQWLIGMPVVFVLLAVIGAIRFLASIPGFDGIVQRASQAVNFLLLHWVASMQAFLLDYVRSTAMRERFEHEFVPFLQDPHCERIVVVAHSMGTAISYEALTTVLHRPAYRDNRKPITYICLAQAMGRIWRLARTDPHRIRLPLPPSVRWLHFWARYDPIVAGALDARALPSARDWADSDEPEPDDAVRTSLARCQNRIVINRDSLFLDHITYWDNLEQVVGPIARELVAGHTELEDLVEAHLASDEEVLARRWRVGWRSGLAMLLGTATGVVTLGLALAYHLGSATRSTLASLVGALFASGTLLPGFLGLLWRLAGNKIGLAAGSLGEKVGDLLGPTVSSLLLVFLTHAADVLIIATATLLATSLVVVIVSQVVAEPSPFAFRATGRRSGRAAPHGAPAHVDPADKPTASVSVPTGQ
jgi:hypothetical protein